MKKVKSVFICGLLIALCIVAGCKKDYQNNKIYLLSQQITDDREDGYPIDTANYTYDAKNRITGITDGTLPDLIRFAIDYDDKNRVTIARKFDGSGNLIIEFDFFYKGDTIGYYFHGPAATHIADTAYFSFNAKRQLTQIATKHSGSQTFGYDSNGNLSTTQAIANDGSYTIDRQTSFDYDNQRNPFSESSANNYFFMYVVRIGNPSTLIHNVVERDADTFTYIYNAEGFPLKATIKTYLTTIYVTYNYITR